MRRNFTLCAAVVFMAGASIAAHAAQQPNFSGVWKLDVEKSDDSVKAVEEGFGRLAKGRDQMLQRYLADVLVQLAQDAEELEIEHSEKDIVLFDAADNVNIYYIDGKKHTRQSQELGVIETVAEWNGDELVIKSKGKNVGEAVEVMSMEGDQLLVSVRVKAKTFENDVVANFYYDRVE